MSLQLRPYQQRAVADVRSLVRQARRRILVVAPTGAGKTTLAADLILGAVQRGNRCWFVAHRRELIKQAFVRLVRAGLEARDVGILLGDTKHASGELLFSAGANDDELFAAQGRRRPRAMIQVCSIDSLRSRMNRDTPADTLAEARSLEHPDLVIIDEAHRCLAASYLKLVQLYPHAVVLGLTATPYRADKRGLGEVYTEMVVVAQPEELIEEGHLVRPRVFTVPAKDLPNLHRLKISGGDYDVTALSAAVDQEGLVGNIVEHWKRRAEGRQTVVFAVDVEHSLHLCARFVADGVRAEHLDGSTPTGERDAILQRLASGETRVVCNVGVLTEGWDCPVVKCCVLARPTKSTGLYLQMAGRILRPHGDAGALILDHAGCAIEHGLPHEDRTFSLESDKKQTTRENLQRSRVCEQCFAVLEGNAQTCEHCGFTFPPKAEKDKVEAPGELVEVRNVTRDEKAARYTELLELAKSTGRKPGWAYYRFKDEFGCEPPRGLRPKAEQRLDAPVEEKREFFEALVRTQTERNYNPAWVTIRFKERFGCFPDAAWWVEVAA